MSICQRIAILDSMLNFLSSDPATNEELGTVPDMGLSETVEAIEAAHRAFPAWSRLSARVRLHPIMCRALPLWYYVETPRPSIQSLRSYEAKRR